MGPRRSLRSISLGNLPRLRAALWTAPEPVVFSAVLGDGEGDLTSFFDCEELCYDKGDCIDSGDAISEMDGAWLTVFRDPPCVLEDGTAGIWDDCDGVCSPDPPEGKWHLRLGDVLLEF